MRAHTDVEYNMVYFQGPSQLGSMVKCDRTENPPFIHILMKSSTMIWSRNEMCEYAFFLACLWAMVSLREADPVRDAELLWNSSTREWDWFADRCWWRTKTEVNSWKNCFTWLLGGGVWPQAGNWCGNVALDDWKWSALQHLVHPDSRNQNLWWGRIVTVFSVSAALVVCVANGA